MINREQALEIHARALSAISELSKAAQIMASVDSGDVREQMLQAIGLSIGKIQMSVLELLYQEHPDLDDLA